MAPFRLQHDKAVGEAKGAEDVRPLVAGGGDFQLALRVTAENAALKIGAPHRFFSALVVFTRIRVGRRHWVYPDSRANSGWTS